MSKLIQKKICMLGDFAVGKTSLVERYVYNRFSDRYLSTIGVKIARKSFHFPDDLQLNLLIWDLAGSEEFAGVQSSYLHGTAGALLVCDLTRANTLPSIENYRQRLITVSPDVAMLILGNKADLTQEREVQEEQIADLAASVGMPFFITSAKSGEGVEEAFQTLAHGLIAHA